MSYVAPYVAASGLTIPTYQDILDYLIAQMKIVYGNDIYLEIDSTDYQSLSVFALMVYDCMATAQLVYNNRAPSTAIGAALDSLLKINGLTRLVATYSTVDLTITGTVGTIILNGQASDVSGNKWNLPATVTIPVGGTITVTATAEDEGDITATAGTITQIETPVYGWISVTNASAATSGNAVETDAEVRARQAISTALPSLSVIEGIAGAIANLTSVVSVKYYENKTNTTDSNGIPGHSVSFIVNGGDSEDIAQVLFDKMTPGTGYYGTTSVVVTDDYGLSTNVQFFRPTVITVDVEVSLTALVGYTSAVGVEIQEAVVAYVESLEIGQDVLWSRILGASLLMNTDNEETFNVTNVKLAINGSSPYVLSATDVIIAFNEESTCEISNVTLLVTT